MELKKYLSSELEEDARLGTGGTPRRGQDPAAYPGEAALFVDPADPDLVVRSTPQSYVARPVGDEVRPAVLIVHENKGLTAYVMNVARRLAKLGYVAVAVDLLGGQGGTASFASTEDVIAAIYAMDDATVVTIVRESLARIAAEPTVDANRIGILGFCYGGGVTWRTLTSEHGFAAAIVCYGPNPRLELVPDITTPVLGIYGELDERITPTVDEMRTAMSRHGKLFEVMIFEGGLHGFHNDTNPERYHPQRAGQAWDAMVSWLARWLGATGA